MKKKTNADINAAYQAAAEIAYIVAVGLSKAEDKLAKRQARSA